MFLGVGLAAFLACGCRSTGPGFDARGSGPAAGLQPDAFHAVQSTNQIPPEWLLPPTEFFRLGPGDAIEIEMLGEADSKATASVGPDGRIYYNLLPGLFVWGLTLSEVKEVLEGGLAKYMRLRPEVTVTLRTATSAKVWVLGNIARPGLYPMAVPLTLLEVISGAGGLQTLPSSGEEVVDLKHSFVLREGRLLPVDFHKLFREGDLSQNVYLRPDDFVYLRPAGSRDIYVLGAVVTPNVLGYMEQFTLTAAIAYAGGTIPYAHLTQIAIIRGSLTKPVIAAVDYRSIVKGQAPDVVLEPGDIVYVPYRPFYKLEILAEQILEQFVRTIAINEGNRAVDPNASPTEVTVPFQ